MWVVRVCNLTNGTQEENDLKQTNNQSEWMEFGKISYKVGKVQVDLDMGTINLIRNRKYMGIVFVCKETYDKMFVIV